MSLAAALGFEPRSSAPKADSLSGLTYAAEAWYCPAIIRAAFRTWGHLEVLEGEGVHVDRSKERRDSFRGDPRRVAGPESGCHVRPPSGRIRNKTSRRRAQSACVHAL